MLPFLLVLGECSPAMRPLDACKRYTEKRLEAAVDKCMKNQSCPELTECDLYYTLKAAPGLQYYYLEVDPVDVDCFTANCDDLCENRTFNETVCNYGEACMCNLIATRWPTVQKVIRECNINKGEPCDTIPARVCNVSAYSNQTAATCLRDYCAAICGGSQQEWCPPAPPEQQINWVLIGGAAAGGVVLVVLVIVVVCCCKKRRKDDGGGRWAKT
jgi:hypothetical protein